MDTYDKHLADSQRVALIHVSYDKKDSDAEAWAAKERMTWPTILGSDRKASGAGKLSQSDYVPEYRLIDRKGREVAPEGQKSIAKAVELADEAER